MAYPVMFYIVLALFPWTPFSVLAEDGDTEAQEAMNPYAPPNTQERLVWSLETSFFDDLASRLPVDASDKIIYSVTRNLLAEKFQEFHRLRPGFFKNVKRKLFEHYIRTLGLDQIPPPAEMIRLHSEVTRAILEFVKPRALVEYSRREAVYREGTRNPIVTAVLEDRLAITKRMLHTRVGFSYLFAGATGAVTLSLEYFYDVPSNLKVLAYSNVALSTIPGMFTRVEERNQYRLLSDEFIARADDYQAARRDRDSFDAPLHKKCAGALSRLYQWVRRGGVFLTPKAR